MVSILWAVYLVTAVTVDCRRLHGHHSQNTSLKLSPEDFDIENTNMKNPSSMTTDEPHRVGDMLLTEKQWNAWRMRKAIDTPNSRWTEVNGFPQVPYVFDGAYPAAFTSNVSAGMDHWMNHTCITFIDITTNMPSSNMPDPYLKFNNAQDCSSYVGRYLPGQTISLGQCPTPIFGSVVHEIGHAIGFWHEQQRSDRDDYIYILENKGTTDNSYLIMADNNYSIPYDYSSAMHYSDDIVAKDPLSQEILGTSLRTRLGLSHRDKLLANTMYKCIDKWVAKCKKLNGMDPCLNEGYTGPKNCKCVCPPGTTGPLCEVFVAEYYAHLQNPISEKISTMESIKVETPINGKKVGYSGSTFVKWIVPPTCKTAKVIFKSSNLNTGLNEEYMDIRTISSDLIGTKWNDDCIKSGPTLESNTGIIITTKYQQKTKKTLWEADVTFENIKGCSVSAPVLPKMGCSIYFPNVQGWQGHKSGNLKFSSPVAVSSWKLELIFDIHLTKFTRKKSTQLCYSYEWHISVVLEQIYNDKRRKECWKNLWQKDHLRMSQWLVCEYKERRRYKMVDYDGICWNPSTRNHICTILFPSPSLWSATLLIVHHDSNQTKNLK